MRFVQTTQCNAVLGAPAGTSIEECHALPIMRAMYENGQHVVVSFWQMSDEERAKFIAGEPIHLVVWGQTMAPVALGVGAI